MSHDGIQTPQRVEFTAKCFGATLSVARQLGDTWALSLFTFVGADRKYRSIAHAMGARGQVPRVDSGDKEDAPTLWLGGIAIDIPPSLVPQLSAFIAEHTTGGAE